MLWLALSLCARGMGNGLWEELCSMQSTSDDEWVQARCRPHLGTAAAASSPANLSDSPFERPSIGPNPVAMELISPATDDLFTSADGLLMVEVAARIELLATEVERCVVQFWVEQLGALQDSVYSDGPRGRLIAEARLSAAINSTQSGEMVSLFRESSTRFRARTFATVDRGLWCELIVRCTCGTEYAEASTIYSAPNAMRSAFLNARRTLSQDVQTCQGAHVPLPAARLLTSGPLHAAISEAYPRAPFPSASIRFSVSVTTPLDLEISSVVDEMAASIYLVTSPNQSVGRVLEWEVGETSQFNASGTATTIISGSFVPELEGLEVVLLFHLGAGVLCYMNFANTDAINTMMIEPLWPLPDSAVPGAFILELRHRTSSCDRALSLSFEIDSTVVLTEHSHGARVCRAGVSSRLIHWDKPGGHALSVGFVSAKTGIHWHLVEPFRFFVFVPADTVSESGPASQEDVRVDPLRHTVQETLDCWLSPQLGGSWTWLQPADAGQAGRPYGWLYPPGAAVRVGRDSNCGLRLPLAWQPSARCPLLQGAWPRKFDTHRATQVLSHFGLIAFLGDSIMEQHYASFLSAFPRSSVHKVQLNPSILGQHWAGECAGYPHGYTEPRTFAGVLGSVPTLPTWYLAVLCDGMYGGEDIIRILESGDLLAPWARTRCLMECASACMEDARCSASCAMDCASDLGHDGSARAESRALPAVLVMNRGAHYENDEIVLAYLNSTLALIRSISPETIIVWRATIPGTHHCESYFEPFASMDQLPPRETWPTSGWPYNWGLFERQNSLVRKLIANFPGVYYLDVVSASILRRESHPDSAGKGLGKEKNDCLHYCLPGPPDLWTVALVELLALLVSEKNVSALHPRPA